MHSIDYGKASLYHTDDFQGSVEVVAPDQDGNIVKVTLPPVMIAELYHRMNDYLHQELRKRAQNIHPYAQGYTEAGTETPTQAVESKDWPAHERC